MIDDNDHVTLMELSRQLGVVRRRIDETAAKLVGARDGLTAEGLESVLALAMAEKKCDLFNLCVKLEVALAESTEWADELTERLKQLAEGESHGSQGSPWVAADDLGPSRSDQGQAWAH